MATNSKQKEPNDIIYHISDKSDSSDSDSNDSYGLDSGNIDDKNSWKVKTKKDKRKQPSPSDSPQKANEKRQKGDNTTDSHPTGQKSSSKPKQSDSATNSHPSEQKSSSQPQISDSATDSASSSSNNQSAASQNDNPNPKHHLILFISGKSINLAKQAFSNPIRFKNDLVSQIGQYDAAKIKDDHIILTCSNPKQKTAALNVHQIINIDVTIAEPRNRTSRPIAKTSTFTRNTVIEKGIIFGVPLDITNEDIINETDAVHVRRLSKLIPENSPNRTPTETVVLSFEHSLPTNINIGILHFRVKQYIPLPFRCNNCQRFGHGSDQCYRSSACPRCSGSHTFEHCTNKETTKCSNCHGAHSSAWTGCPKYQEIKQTIRISKTEHISFRDALMNIKQKNSIHQDQCHEDQEQDHTETSTTAETLDHHNTTSTSNNTHSLSSKHTAAEQTATVTQMAHNTDLENKIITLQKNLEELITFTNNLQQLLKYCIMGIVLGLDKPTCSCIHRSSEENVLKSQIDSFKSLLPQFANACNLDLGDLQL